MEESVEGADRWLAAARVGSCEALDHALQACHEFLSAVAAKELERDRCGPAEVADLVQETCQEAQRDFAQFLGNSDAELRVWLRQVLLSRVAERRLSETRTAPPSPSATLPVSRASASVLPPQLGRFRILRELGRGGFGVVYLAFDPKLKREVALKVPRPEAVARPEVRARFQHEAEAMAGLDHPNLVSVFEAGEEGDVCYIASAYCPGVTLRAWLQGRAEPVPFDQAAQLVATMAEAMEHAHRHAILHRDLKPGNVMLTLRCPSDGPRPAAGGHDADYVPRIMDFGLAKVLQAEEDARTQDFLTQTGAIVGTPAYMAPEQAEGQHQAVGPAGDVYALGAILYELLTGRPPFHGGTAVETLLRVRTEDPLSPLRLRGDVPRDLDTICLKCLHKDPRRRYPSAQALADELHRYMAREPIEARRPHVVDRLVLWCRRKPALAATIVLALAAVAFVAGVGLYQVLQERERYRRERDLAQANLYRALIGEAQALMQGRDTGWWWKAMDGIRQAAALEVAGRDRGHLRELAVECMGTKYPCLRLHGTWAGHGGAVTTVEFDSHGGLAASGSGDTTVRLWSVPDGRPLAVLSGHDGPVSGVAFHPSLPSLASVSFDGTLRLWDIAALQAAAQEGRPGTPVSLSAAQTTDLKGGRIHAVAFSPEGDSLAAACEDGDVHVLALDQGRLRPTAGHAVLSARAGPVSCLAFSPTGHLASGSANKSVRIWDLVTQQETDYWATPNVPTAIAFSPDGGLLTYVEREIFGVVMRPMHMAAMVEGHSQIHAGAVSQVRYNRKGHLLTSSADGSLKIWQHSSARGLQELAVARGDCGEIRAAAMNAEGDWVASGYPDGLVRIWEFSQPPQRTFVSGDQQHGAFVGGKRCLANYVGLFDFSGGARGAMTAFRSEKITALAVHPEGRWYAFGGEKGALNVGDIERPAVITPCAGHEQMVSFLASSPDGKRLASASADGTVRLWSWKTGEQDHVLQPALGALHGLAWSEDNCWLAITGQWGVVVWDANAPAPLETATPPQAAGVAVQPLGPSDVAGETHGPPRPTDQGGSLRQVSRHSLRTSSVALRADLIAFSGPEGSVEVRELSTGRSRHTLRGHAAAVSALEFSPDGSLLASAAGDGKIKLWQSKTGEETAALEHRGLVASFLDFDPQGRYLASDTTHAVAIWDVRANCPDVAFFSGTRMRFLKDNSAVLVGTWAGSVHRCALGELEQARAAAKGSTRLSSSGFVQLHFQSTLVHGAHTNAVWGIAASADGRWVATAGHDEAVKLWDVQTLRLVRTLSVHQDIVWCVAFSPDSRYLASGGGDVIVSEVATGRTHRCFPGHQALILGLAFHPQRPWLASSSLDGSVRLWDWDAGKPLGVLHDFGRSVYSLAFRPDGKCLAASCMDGRVAVWDLSGSDFGASPPSRFLKGPTAAVYAVGFSADGRYLAAGSERGVIMLWDARTFEPVVTLRGGTGQIRTVVFSRDGGLLAGAAYVAPTIVWDLKRLRDTLVELNLDW